MTNRLNPEYTSADPCVNGWNMEDGVFVPDMNLKPLPASIRVICKCEGKCLNKKCACKKEGQTCILFCHKSTESKYENK